MRPAKPAAPTSNVSEMAVVDTFTKLIFDQSSEYSSEERSIIEALRLVDDNLLPDTPREMGAYLRALGVEEMIALVSHVVERFAGSPPAAGIGRSETASPRASRHIH